MDHYALPLTPLHAFRSVTMDAWSGDQLRKMQLGGNDALNSFLKKYSVDKFTDIKEKYSSQAAEVRVFLLVHVLSIMCCFQRYRIHKNNRGGVCSSW